MMSPSVRSEIGEAGISAAVRLSSSVRREVGAEVALLEQDFAISVGGRHCVSVSSDAAALQMSLLALGIGAGDEVILPAFDSPSTADAVRSAGAAPVFADIDPHTFCLDPDSVTAAVSAFTAAVVPVHTFGHPAAMDALRAVTESRGIALIERVGRAHGAALHGRPVGTFGSAAVFSLESSGPDGPSAAGMVVTHDPAVARTLRLMRGWPRGGRGPFPDRSGTVGVLTDAAAATARERLRRLPALLAGRREAATVLDARLTGVTTPHVARGAGHAYDRYTVRVPGNGRPDRDAFARALAARGVGSEVPHSAPVHRTRAHRCAVRLPGAEEAAEHVLSLPVRHTLPRELGRVISACNALGGLLPA